MAKQHTTTYDVEGNINVPPFISHHSCMGRYFIHYRRNIHDNKRQKTFINSCNFALTYPQKSKMLLHTITNECTSSIFRMINRTVKNHKQSASTPDCRTPGVSFHNDRSATRKNSKHTLSKRHIFFALNVIKRCRCIIQRLTTGKLLNVSDASTSNQKLLLCWFLLWTRKERIRRLPL